MSETRQQSTGKGSQATKDTLQALPQVTIPPALSVKQLADIMGISPVEVIKQLMRNGVMANINQSIDFNTAALIASHFGYEAKKRPIAHQAKPKVTVGGSKLSPRPPVITIMG